MCAARATLCFSQALPVHFAVAEIRATTDRCEGREPPQKLASEVHTKSSPLARCGATPGGGACARHYIDMAGGAGGSSIRLRSSGQCQYLAAGGLRLRSPEAQSGHTANA